MATEEDNTNGINPVITGKTEIVELMQIEKELEDKNQKVLENGMHFDSDKEILLNLEKEISDKIIAFVDEEEELKKKSNDLENEKIAFEQKTTTFLSFEEDTARKKDEINKLLSELELKRKETQAKNIELDNRESEIKKTENILMEKENANQRKISEIEEKWLNTQKSQERVLAAVDEAKELLKYKKDIENLKETYELLKEKVKEEYKKYSKGALEKKQDEDLIYKDNTESKGKHVKNEDKNIYSSIEQISESIINNDFESASREIEFIAKKKEDMHKSINDAQNKMTKRQKADKVKD